MIYSDTCAYILIVLCFTINHEKFAQLFMDGYTIRVQGIVKLWIQRKGDHSNIKSEYGKI